MYSISQPLPITHLPPSLSLSLSTLSLSSLPQEGDDMAAEQKPQNTDHQPPQAVMPLRCKQPELPFYTVLPAPEFLGLSKGWGYELRPRTNIKYLGKIDKFYIEPGTGRVVRSLKAALELDRIRKEQQNGYTADNVSELVNEAAEGSKKSPKSGKKTRSSTKTTTTRKPSKKKMKAPDVGSATHTPSASEVIVVPDPMKNQQVEISVSASDVNPSSTSAGEPMVLDTVENQQAEASVAAAAAAADANVDASNAGEVTE